MGFAYSVGVHRALIRKARNAMGLLGWIAKWESTAAARAATHQEVVDLQARRIRLLFESLKHQGFTEDQAVQILSGRHA